ncbi:GntR family transcriptional regulator [Taklimakanibacter lacteus]|uniref:GntR family transcriptional regulator n=1 Tax=Taklimakanibacter lacteus TaxID=2268456 RepID=UPI000E661DEF
MPKDETQDSAASLGLTVRLYDELTRAILAGELQPGEKLSEPAIAAQYGASRAPVREAIRRLQERGLVTYVANQGVRVSQPTGAEFLALLDVREALEGMAARLAAINMDDDEIKALEGLVAGHRGQIERNPLGAYLQEEPDTDFHIHIARGSGNLILAELLCDEFYPRLRLCRRLHRTVPGRGHEAWKEHLRITDAIVQRDGELAEILMRRHIRAAKVALQTALAAAAAATPVRKRSAARSKVLS